LFDTIVWATDGSPTADRALEIARKLAQDDGTSLVVVHVVQHYLSKGGFPVYPDEEVVKAKLEETVQQLSNDGFRPTLKIVNQVGPQPASSIADVAREVGADLIVTGTRGHGPITGLLLGSVALRLLHISPCPVVAVPVAEGSHIES
jgi:nucleotide-binding universal stress UspA family protein